MKWGCPNFFLRFSEISNYLDRQFDFVLAEESRIRRNPRFTDSRVHAIVYFITATGHGLREPDVVFMKHIATKANVIPVLAKADGLTPEEVELNKKLIMEDIKKYEIPVYGFPGGDGFQYADGDDAGSVKGKGSMHSRSNYGDSASEEEEEDSGSDSGSIVDEEFLEFSKVAKAKVPFAVIGASDIDSNHGQLVRRYPWGTVDIDDPAVSDMAIVREVVTKTHVNDLRDTTEYVLYENYRTYKLSVDLQEEEEEKDKTVESNIVTANTSVASLQPPPSMSRGATSKGTADTSLMDEDSTSETQSTHKDHAFGLGGGSSSSNVHLPLSPGGLGRQSSLSGSELAPAALLREEKMRASEARLKETESKLAQDLQQRRAELVAQEAQLRLLEEQLRSQAAALREDKERVSALEARP